MAPVALRAAEHRRSAALARREDGIGGNVEASRHRTSSPPVQCSTRSSRDPLHANPSSSSRESPGRRKAAGPQRARARRTARATIGRAQLGIADLRRAACEFCSRAARASSSGGGSEASRFRANAGAPPGGRASRRDRARAPTRVTPSAASSTTPAR
jgi:hypothetical protein